MHKIKLKAHKCKSNDKLKLKLYQHFFIHETVNEN